MAFEAGAAVAMLRLNLSDYARGMMEATSIARVFPATVQNFMASPLLGLTGIARSVASSIASAFSGGFKLAMDFEQAEVAFGVLLGGTDNAKKALKDLSDFAAATPFEMPELVAASRNLLAFGVSQEQLIPTLRAVGDVASGIGAPLGQIAEIYGKARVQGRLFMEDINQLTGRGIPIIGELAKQFGVAESQVRKLVETGQVDFDNLEQAFVSMTGAGGTFGSMMERQSRTMTGQWSTLKDTWNTLLREMATPVMVALQPAMKELLAWVETNMPTIREALVGTMNFLAGAIRVATPLVKLLMDNLSVIGPIAGVVVAAIAGITAALKVMTIAKVIAAAVSGPGGWAMLAAGAVAAGVAIAGISSAFKDATTEAQNFQRQMNQSSAAAVSGAAGVNVPITQAPRAVMNQIGNGAGTMGRPAPTVHIQNLNTVVDHNATADAISRQIAPQIREAAGAAQRGTQSAIKAEQIAAGL